MMFGEVVSLVQYASAPIDMELSLLDAVANPVKAHVDGLGTFLFDWSLAIPAAVMLSVCIGVGG